VSYRIFVFKAADVPGLWNAVFGRLSLGSGIVSLGQPFFIPSQFFVSKVIAILHESDANLTIVLRK
jgi:hypothetical protein